jgi:hypothetical protein
LARFGPEIHTAQNGDRVILRAYYAFRFEFLAHNCATLRAFSWRGEIISDVLPARRAFLQARPRFPA